MATRLKRGYSKAYPARWSVLASHTPARIDRPVAQELEQEPETEAKQTTPTPPDTQPDTPPGTKPALKTQSSSASGTRRARNKQYSTKYPGHWTASQGQSGSVTPITKQEREFGTVDIDDPLGPVKGHGVSNSTKPQAGLYSSEVGAYFPSYAHPFGPLKNGSSTAFDNGLSHDYTPSVFQMINAGGNGADATISLEAPSYEPAVYSTMPYSDADKRNTDGSAPVQASRDEVNYPTLGADVRYDAANTSNGFYIQPQQRSDHATAVAQQFTPQVQHSKPIVIANFGESAAPAEYRSQGTYSDSNNAVKSPSSTSSDSRSGSIPFQAIQPSSYYYSKITSPHSINTSSVDPHDSQPPRPAGYAEIPYSTHVTPNISDDFMCHYQGRYSTDYQPSRPHEKPHPEGAPADTDAPYAVANVPQPPADTLYVADLAAGEMHANDYPSAFPAAAPAAPLLQQGQIQQQPVDLNKVNELFARQGLGQLEPGGRSVFNAIDEAKRGVV